jgi:hypothetical protein
MALPMFEACLSLPRNPREAALIADNLEGLARALREWPIEAWRKVSTTPPAANTGDVSSGLFARLVARTAPAALDSQQRARALGSAEAVADVLRILWPPRGTSSGSPPRTDGDVLLATV